MLGRICSVFVWYLVGTWSVFGRYLVGNWSVLGRYLSRPGSYFSLVFNGLNHSFGVIEALFNRFQNPR